MPRMAEAVTIKHPGNREMIPYFVIWTGQALSLLGSVFVQFALVWWLTQTSHSATSLSMATLAAILPGIVVSPLAGTLTDRWNRRTVMILADGSVALVTLGLIGINSRGVMQPWHVYVAMFLRAIGNAFHYPAMQASTTLMVPQEHRPRVAGMSQALIGTKNILGPPVGAFLVGVLPMQGVLSIDIFTALLAIGTLLIITVPQPTQATYSAGTSSLWADLRAGLRYLLDWPGVLALGLIAALVNLFFYPVMALVPLLVKDYFAGGALQLGWMNSAWGSGLIAGGLILGIWGGFKRRVITSFAGLVTMGICLTLLGFSPAGAFWLALGFMFLVGATNAFVNGPLIAAVQDVSAAAMQGRVFSLGQGAIMAITPLGLAIAGPLADWLGVRSWFVISGVVCAMLGLVSFTLPVMMRLEDGKHE
jgi:DHA3 family macrolide efflux protein-like MFS transporter